MIQGCGKMQKGRRKMIKAFPYKNREIHIEYNEAHLTRDYQYDYIKKQIAVKTLQFPYSYSLGVEIAVHRGGRICCGIKSGLTINSTV